jgi:hypothetical protein
MRIKTTAPGAPVDDMNLLFGDPFEQQGLRYGDQPDPTEVNRDIEQMDRHYDHLGTGAYDQRHEAERAMRDTLVIGNYQHPEDMFQHGAEMPMRMEDAVRYSAGSTREAVAQRQEFSEALWNEYRTIYGDEAADDPRLAQAVERTLGDYKWRGENPKRAARERPHDFLRDVDLARAGSSYSTSEDSGRTAGIGSGAPAARGQPQEDKGDFIEELQSRQRASGFY